MIEADTSSNPDALEEGLQRPPRQAYEEESSDDVSYGVGTQQKGPLLDLPEKEAAALAAKMWRGRDREMSPRLAQWKVNALRRMGVPGVRLERSEDDISAFVPGTVTPDTISIVNKAAWVVRRLVAILFADPPAPEVVAASGEDEDVEAAEFANRALETEGGEAGTRDALRFRQAVDRGCTYASGFVHYYVEPNGGGLQPIEVEASPMASSVQDATQRPRMRPVMAPNEVGVMVQVGEEPEVDPTSGELVMEPWPGEYVTRYVTPKGLLSDGRADAARHWVPQVRSEVLDGRQVRLIPHTAEDIWEAHGAQIGFFKTWAEAKAEWPKLAELEKAAEGGDEEAQKTLAGIRAFEPEKVDHLLDGRQLRVFRHYRTEKDKALSEEFPIFGLITYYRSCPSYPEGAAVVTLGESYVASRRAWDFQREDGETELLDIPLTQFKFYSEGTDDPYGVAPMQVVGPINELRGAIWGTFERWLERFGDPKTFVPLNSNLKRHEVEGRGGMYRINPGSEPRFEQVPQPSPIMGDLWTLAGQEVDNELGLQEAAQGVQDPNVKSGRQAYAIISQVHAGLSDLKQNIEAGCVRGWRIQLQMYRAFYTSSRRLRWTAADGSYRERSWMGADLRSSRDVRVKAGTLTMLSEAAKAQLSEQLFAAQVLDPVTFKHQMTTRLGGLIGLQDDPQRMRILGQINEWEKGPPERSPEETAQLEQVAVAAQQLGQPIPADPAAAAIFDPRPSDDLPESAQVRVYEMARAMAKRSYAQFPPAWRAALEMEFFRAQQAIALAMAPAPGAEGVPADAAEEAEGASGGGNPLGVPGGVPPEIEGRNAAVM